MIYNEKHLETSLVNQLKSLLPDTYKIETQKKLRPFISKKNGKTIGFSGLVDIFINNPNGTKTIIEVKKYKNDRSLIDATSQIMFYKYLCNTTYKIATLAVASDKFTPQVEDFYSEYFPEIQMIRI